MASLAQDVRHSVRLIRRNKSFTIAVLLSTTLGIGATASIFSLIDAFFLRPLAVPQTSRVVRITSVTQSNAVGRLSYPEIDEIQARTQTLAGVATAQNAVFGAAQSAGEQPRVTYGAFVNGNFFSLLGITPAAGRTFRADEDQIPGRDAVVVISHTMWQRDFGGRPDVVGRHLRLNAVDFEIVGVAPASFTGPHPFFQPALYVPRMMIREASGAATNALTDRTIRSVDVFARLKPGVSVDQARDEIRRLAADMEREHPETNRTRSAMVFSQIGYRIAEDPDNLVLSWLLFAVAALVLSIACVNITNLLLSTAPARTRETAVRLAMGASRFRLLRQSAVESTILSVIGSIAGLGLAAGSAWFIRSIEIASNLPLKLDTRVDVRVALFAFAVGLTSGVAAALIPAIRSSRTDLNSVLKDTGQRFAASRGRMRHALVIGQVAVALVMTILSGLFLKSIQVARRTDPGFRVANILTMGFDPRIARYDAQRTRLFYRELLDRVRALPGVRSAALGQHVPLGVEGGMTELAIDGYDTTPQTATVAIGSAIVGADFFDTLGIPIVRGRTFDSTDTDTKPGVAIVNEVMASKYWPKRDALGATLTIGSKKVEVVGVARTSKTRDIGESPQPYLYLPFEQSTQTRMFLFVATDGDAGAFAGAVRGEVRALDPNQPVYDVQTLASHFEQQALFGVRLIAQVIAAVGAVGLALSVLGLYAVIAYSVSQRTREIGIRMAVGASERRVLGLVLRQGFTLAAIGVSIGLALSLAAATVIRDLLNGANPRDPIVYTSAVAGLLTVTMLATLLPARRAAHVDPQVALRCE